MKKEHIISLKIEHDLYQKLSNVDNKSEFIRNAILSSLGHTCEFCLGSGLLSVNQRKHYAPFFENHKLISCKDCGEYMTIECKDKKDN